MARHQYFSKNKDLALPNSLIVPESPMNLRNDCKEASWYLGEIPYGNRLKFICIKFSRRIATEQFGAVQPGTPLGQIWFVPVQGGESPDGQKLPCNVVYYTLLKNSNSGKSGSLINFGQKAVLAQSQGYDYRELVWSAQFIKKSATIENEAVSYYVLDFSYQEPDEVALGKIDQAVAILENRDDLGRLFDPDLEISTRCIDGLESQAIAQLTESLRMNRAQLPQG